MLFIGGCGTEKNLSAAVNSFQKQPKTKGAFRFDPERPC
jgi:hypothetical protein